MNFLVPRQSFHVCTLNTTTCPLNYGWSLLSSVSHSCTNIEYISWDKDDFCTVVRGDGEWNAGGRGGNVGRDKVFRAARGELNKVKWKNPTKQKWKAVVAGCVSEFNPRPLLSRGTREINVFIPIRLCFSPSPRRRALPLAPALLSRR